MPGCAQTANPIARDIASTGARLCDGKVRCQTQGENPVFDDDGGGRLDILLAGHGRAPCALMHNNGNNTHFTQTFDFPKTHPFVEEGGSWGWPTSMAEAAFRWCST